MQCVILAFPDHSHLLLDLGPHLLLDRLFTYSWIRIQIVSHFESIPEIAFFRNKQFCKKNQQATKSITYSACKELNEPVHEISNNVACATSKASDQPAHTRSLIRAFASRLNIHGLLSY